MGVSFKRMYVRPIFVFYLQCQKCSDLENLLVYRKNLECGSSLVDIRQHVIVHWGTRKLPRVKYAGESVQNIFLPRTSNEMEVRVGKKRNSDVVRQGSLFSDTHACWEVLTLVPLLCHASHVNSIMLAMPYAIGAKVFPNIVKVFFFQCFCYFVPVSQSLKQGD